MALSGSATSTPIACVLAGGRSRRPGRPGDRVGGWAAADLLSAGGAGAARGWRQSHRRAGTLMSVWRCRCCTRRQRCSPAAGIAAAPARRRPAGGLLSRATCRSWRPAWLRYLAEAPGRLVVPRAGGNCTPVRPLRPGARARARVTVAAGRALHETIAALDPVVVDEEPAAPVRRSGSACCSTSTHPRTWPSPRNCWAAADLAGAAAGDRGGPCGTPCPRAGDVTP